MKNNVVKLDLKTQETTIFPAEWRRGLYETIFRRRDIRKFKPDPVAPEILARMLNAAHHAGSVGFMQPWNFVIVQDQNKKQRVFDHVDAERIAAGDKFDSESAEKYLTFKLEGIREAPINLCVTCDPTRNGPAVIGRNTIRETDVYSTVCAIQNLWLAGRSEGVGVGWVSIYKPEVIQEILGIPEHVIPVAYLCIGYPEAFLEEPLLHSVGWIPRAELAPLVFEENWGQPISDEFEECLKNHDGKTDV